MADRADDIKQLFSHLGLDPGGYQELRTRNRPEAGAPAASPTPPAPTQTPAAVTPPPSRSHARDGAALAASLFGNVAAAVSSGAATRTPPAPAAVPAAPTQPAPRLVPEARVAPPASTLRAAPATETPAPAVSPESTRRWSLIRAATEATPKVAQIRPDLRAARPEASAPAAPPVARAEPPVIVLEGPLPSVGPTERLVEALQQDPEETTRRLSAMVARRRSAEAEAPTRMPVMEPPAAPPAPVASRPEPLLPVSEADTALAATFRRLVTPARAPTAHEVRLRLPYGARPEREVVEPDAAARPLSEVFARLGGPRG